jgi:hypothetical protein
MPKEDICGPRNENTRPSVGDVVISRMPMFNFLEIPDSLRKQFKIPGGCLITEE